MESKHSAIINCCLYLFIEYEHDGEACERLSAYFKLHIRRRYDKLCPTYPLFLCLGVIERLCTAALNS